MFAELILFATTAVATVAESEAVATTAEPVAVATVADDLAERLRLEAREDAERRRQEAREDAKALKSELKEAEALAKAEEKERRGQITSKVFRLNHASASDVAERLNEMWNGEFGQVWKVTRMAVPFDESNSVLVTAPQMILDACEQAVGALDVETPQVYIEARFVELGNTASHKVGINWEMLDGLRLSAQGQGALESTRLGKAVTDFSRETSDKGTMTAFKMNGDGGSDGRIRYFSGTLNVSQMAMTIHALDRTEDVKTFSNPKIIVSSGKKAIVDMTTKYPNVQIAAKKTINNNNESVDLDMKMMEIPGEDKFMFAKEAFFSWGIELEVLPRISTNGLISVSIVPTISQLDTDYGDGGFVSAGTSDDSGAGYSARYPIIEVKRLVTEFSMESGTTAVIGGLSKTVERQIDTGIPILKDIPWIGSRLFGSMERVKDQKEIIVFVTVGLVDPRSVKEDAGMPKNAVLGRQYTQGQKLEPGDRPEKNMEGIESLDLRPLEEQAKDPLRQHPKEEFRFGDYMPFTKDPNYKSKE